jgi:hypothetical protein
LLETPYYLLHLTDGTITEQEEHKVRGARGEYEPKSKREDMGMIREMRKLFGHGKVGSERTKEVATYDVLGDWIGGACSSKCSGLEPKRKKEKKERHPPTRSRDFVMICRPRCDGERLPYFFALTTLANERV